MWPNSESRPNFVPISYISWGIFLLPNSTFPASHSGIISKVPVRPEIATLLMISTRLLIQYLYAWHVLLNVLLYYALEVHLGFICSIHCLNDADQTFEFIHPAHSTHKISYITFGCYAFECGKLGILCIGSCSIDMKRPNSQKASQFINRDGTKSRQP